LSEEQAVGTNCMQKDLFNNEFTYSHSEKNCTPNTDLTVPTQAASIASTLGWHFKLQVTL